MTKLPKTIKARGIVFDSFKINNERYSSGPYYVSQICSNHGAQFKEIAGDLCRPTETSEICCGIPGCINDSCIRVDIPRNEVSAITFDDPERKFLNRFDRDRVTLGRGRREGQPKPKIEILDLQDSKPKALDREKLIEGLSNSFSCLDPVLEKFLQKIKNGDFDLK